MQQVSILKLILIYGMKLHPIYIHPSLIMTIFLYVRTNLDSIV